MNVNTLFFNQIGRLRSGWRFMVFLALYIGAGVLLGGAATAILTEVAVGYEQGTAVYFTVNGLMSLGAALAVGWLCGRVFEDLPFRALGASFTEDWWRHLLVGLLIGAVSISLAVLLSGAGGGFRISLNTAAEGQDILNTLAVSLVVFATAAAFEEALFRGYVLQTFSRAGLAWLAIGLTSVFFGAVHLMNPSAGSISTMNTVIAGVWFGVAYLKSRDLWLPFGLHLAWNWMQGAVFGIEVSGLKSITTAPLFREIDHGPVWLTGGDYGVEGGIGCTAALLVSMLFLYLVPLAKPSPEVLELTSTEKPVTRT